MDKDNKENLALQQKLLARIKRDVIRHKYTQPRRYRENLDYFQRMDAVSR